MASISGVDIALVDCRVIVLLDDKEDVHIITLSFSKQEWHHPVQ